MHPHTDPLFRPALVNISLLSPNILKIQHDIFHAFATPLANEFMTPPHLHILRLVYVLPYPPNPLYSNRDT